MSPVVKEVLLFIVGLICLVKGGDWFVDGATGIAHRFKMPEILIGATVVSIGTTIPEVMVSSTAALTEGASDIAYGNAIGSIICNTALIAAITMTFRPAALEKKALRLPVIFFFASAVFFAVIAYTTGNFSRPVGITLLIIFLVYMTLCVRQARNVGAGRKGASDDTQQHEEEIKGTTLKDILFIVAGAAVVAVGANLLVNNGTLLAEAAGVPQTVIALTFVALGTSLPELVTAITSLIKGHSDLSLGNVIGANLFNLVLVLGASTTLGPFHIPAEKTIAGMNASLVIDMPLMFIVMLIMCLPALIKGRIYRSQGIVLLIIYFAFVLFQFIS